MRCNGKVTPGLERTCQLLTCSYKMQAKLSSINAIEEQENGQRHRPDYNSFHGSHIWQRLTGRQVRCSVDHSVHVCVVQLEM